MVSETTIIPQEVKVDGVTIDKNGTGQLEVKPTYELYNDIMHKHDAELTYDLGTSGDYLAPIKRKTITLPTNMPTTTIRITWETKCGTTTAGFETISQIYKNGVAVGSLHSMLGGTYVEFTEDLEFTGGDTIELWMGVNKKYYTIGCQNFRIKGHTVVFTDFGKIKTDCVNS